MIENKYPLFSPRLMQESSFTIVAKGYRSPNPEDLGVEEHIDMLIEKFF